MASSFGGTIKLQQESEYRKALLNICNNLKVLGSEMKVVTSQYDKNDSSSKKLKETNEVLNKKINEQEEKVKILKNALEDAKKETDDNSTTTKKWQIELNNAQAELNKMNRELNENYSALNKAKKATDEYNNKSKTSVNSLRELTSEMLKTVAGTSNLGKTIKSDLEIRVDELKGKLNSSKDKVKEFATSVADTVKHPQKLGDTLKEKLIDTADKLQNSVKKDAESIEHIGQASEESGNSVIKLGDIIKANLISDAIKSGLSSLVNGVKELGSTFISIGKQALESYADYEQLVGGVDTLFKENSKTVQEYANNAYKTAGLSANEYMETVTSFSASLLQSLNGDTAKSAQIADMAITDMADNANKMGTSMESIQNAYQGFAKQNYFMLDNLSLGYGGTKSEMERLLADATKLSGINYDISNLNDVYQAIHVIQGELAITGTTAKEASTTIQGSVSSMKSAWKNMLTGIANDNANFEQLTNNLIESIVGQDGEGGVLNNILPRIETILDGIVELVVNLADQLLPKLIDIGMSTITNLVQSISENLPKLLDAANRILNTLIQGLVTAMPQLIPTAMSLLNTVVSTLIENLPMILEAGITVLVELVKGITQSLPTLIPTAIDALILLVETLIDNIDLIVDAGIELLIGLAEGLTDALPTLIDKVPIIIDKLVNAIVDNLPKIIETGIRIQFELAKGLWQALPQLLSKVPQIISSLVSGLLNGLSAIKDVGRNLISGLWEGIKEKWEGLKNSVSNFGQGIVNKFKSVFGIHSPSTVFKEQIGTNLALGIEEGFGDTMSNVAQNMSNMIPTDFDTNVNLNSNSTNPLNYNSMVNAFEDALKRVKVVMNNREMGSFVSDVVESVVYS